MSQQFFTDVIQSDLNNKVGCVDETITTDEDDYSYDKYFLATTAMSNIIFLKDA